MGFTAAHALAESEDGGTARPRVQMPEGPIDEQLHAMRNVVFLEELSSIDTVGEEGVQAENLCAAVNIEYGLPWCT